MPYPDDYKDISAPEDSIQKARDVKEDLELTWSQFLERGARELKANSR